MLPTQDSFTFDYYGRDIVYGRGCLDTLESYLEERGLDSALVVCGSNVGANEELMGPLKTGLGDRLGGVFDKTTPGKLIETVYVGIDAMEEVEAVRDSLDLPTRLRELEPRPEDDFRPTAEYIMDDPPLAQGPEDLESTLKEIEAVLRDAW